MDDLLPGRLTHIFLVSILDAVLLSWIALRLYRRSVRRLMAAGPRVATPSDDSGPAAPAGGAVLAVTLLFGLPRCSRSTCSCGCSTAPRWPTSSCGLQH